MKVITLKCPECGADLTVETDRKDCYCQYCGTHVLFDDETKTTVHVIKNEARIKETELELERLRIEEERQLRKEAENKKRRKIRTILKIIWFFMLIYITIFLYNPPHSEIPDTIALVFMALLFTIGVYLLATHQDKNK